MADVAITPIQLTAGTASADLVGAGTAITNASANQFVITPLARGGHAMSMVIIFEADASGDTVTITAGDNPPSMLGGLAASTITLAASDVKAFMVVPGKDVQDDGTIIATCADNGTLCYALMLPYGFAGGTGVA